MIRLRTIFATLTLLLSAPAAMAQDDPLAPVAKAYIDALPPALGAFTRSREPDFIAQANPGAYSAVYKINESSDLAITISIQRTRPFDWTARRDNIRAQYEGPFLQVGVEGTFTVPGQNDIQTFFGEYGTQMGIRQIWRVKRKDELEVFVFVTIFKDGYRQQLLSTVARDLFGGAIVTPGPPPAPEGVNP